MRYAYEIQSNGTRAVHAFADEASRVEWIAACPAARGVLSGNSRAVKTSLYRDTVILQPCADRKNPAVRP
jgi:hypothetical protein